MPKTSTLITEGNAQLYVHKADTISKKMAVFYNPRMRLNRDICIALLNTQPPMRILDALAASGIRSIRILKETAHTDVTANDVNPLATKLIAKNARKNKVKPTIENRDANALLNSSEGYDYIDLDVFGSPNPFLDQSIKRLSRDGILAITATDTAPLSGTYPKACRRKYWAEPLRNELKHEVGVRILIRKTQLIGAQYDKALIPIYTHSNDHYFRIYFMSLKGKKSVDDMLTLHRTMWHCSTCRRFDIGKTKSCKCKGSHAVAGPLYAGRLWYEAIASAMTSDNANTQKTLSTIAAEANINQVGFYDVHALCKALKLRAPRHDRIIAALNKKGFVAATTHFTPHGIRSDAPYNRFVAVLRSESEK